MKKVSLARGFINIYLLVLLLIVICAGAAVYFVYHRPLVLSQNKTTPQQVAIIPSPSPTPSATTLPSSRPSPRATPTPHLVVNKPSLDLASASVKIIDDDVYLISGEKQQLLISKEANKKLSSLPIQFVDAQLSPDRSKLWIQANGILSPPFLFYVDLNHIDNPIELGASTQVVWSPNSRYIAYTSGASDCGSQKLLLKIFNTEATDSALLTNHDMKEVSDLGYDMMDYTISGWASDSTDLKVAYTAFKNDGCAVMKQVGEGTLTIHIPQK